MTMDNHELDEIRAALSRRGAPWEAGPTTLTRLPVSERRVRLGAVPPPDEMSLEEAVRRALAPRESLIAEPPAPGVPSAYDLRNVGGRNFVTPVKDQGGCGSCVAFGVAAAMEGTFRVQRQDPNLTTDLAEGHLFFCHGRSQGRNCNNGWWPDQALDTCKQLGVADEACYPYVAADQNCTGRCADWQSRVTKVTGYHKVTDRAAMKEWISTRGPLTACFVVFSDFYSYRSGVYRHVSGGEEGGHCVAVIGYDDAQGCWICKNSWGTGWGDSGFFRIAYGECEIDTWQVCAVDGIEESGWLYNQRVTGLWAINEDRNAWVHLAGVGWRKVAPDNDAILVNLLVQLVSAKAANRPVNVRQHQSIIREVYVL
jgi:C1A family cysteine protease